MCYYKNREVKNMRRTRRKRRNNTKKFIIITSLSLLLFLCVCYAAFQTNLSITAKGNIKAKDITDNIVTEGDGLYKAPYEENKFIYRGTNPDNYIWFNEELWRIISKNSDGTYKIIKNNSIGNMAFDSRGYRDASSNGAGGTYCANSINGCNIWAKTDNFKNGTQNGSVLKDAELNTYLNSTFYNQISTEYRNLITSYDYNVGVILVTDDGENIYDEPTDVLIQEEKSVKWNGNIGLINLSEYVLANSNQSSCGTIGTTLENVGICKTTNWIQQIVENTNHKYTWTISPVGSYPDYVHYLINDGIVNDTNHAADAYFEVIPVLYLSSDVLLTGHGTQNSPYTIIN